MSKATAFLLVLLAVVFDSPALADVVYLYDDLGRLVRVIDETGQAATYHYDAVGNLLQISRESGVPQRTTVATVSMSTLPRSARSTLEFTGFNFAGARITASAGISVIAVQAGVDTLTVEVSVDPTAFLGPASLTIQTDYGTTAVPVTIVSGLPVIAGFAPAKALAGMVITITGADFDASTPANNIVQINGVEAQILQATATALRIRVPAGATTGPVSVSTLEGSTTSLQSLEIGALGPERAHVPTTDLLAYWSFDLDGRDDADSLDLTLQGGLDLAPGHIGTALRFTADPTRLAIRPEDDGVLDFGAADFSYALWVQWTAVAGEQLLIEKCQAVSLCAEGGWGLTKLREEDPRGSNGLLAFPLFQSAHGAVVAGRWYHIAVVRQGTAARLYLDGAQIAEAPYPGSVPPVSEPFRIGERGGPQTFPMNGIIDEVGIWARALTPEEIIVLATTSRSS